MSNNSESPIISVRIHLGDMGKEILHLEDDSERSDWLLGFHAGTLGRLPRPGWSHAKECGFHFGASALAEADEFRSKKARGGKISAEKRREKYGSSQPNTPRTLFEHTSEHCSNTVRDSEHCSGAVREILEQTSEQPPNQPTTYRQHPENLQSEKNQPHPIQTAAAVSTQDLPLPPRERPMIAPAATGWSNGLGAEVLANRCSERRQAWLKEQGEVDFTSRPGKLQFLSYCRSVHPQWQIRAATDAYDTWALRNWTHDGRKIGSWWQLVDAWALAADHTEYGERLPMGQFAAGLGLGDAMSAKASGLTKDLI